ncbi:MAG: xylulokinase [Planctomycetota bacterium]|jgi:xylulokinase|nr:xylulokinase [Planctomycetota bacterium]
MLIGVDIGTSGAKAILMTEEGKIVRSHREEYPIKTPHPGWAEQDPGLWLDKASLCVAKVAAGDAASVKGVAFSGQMHGIVLVDGECRPVRNAIIWADNRSRTQLEAIESTVGAAELCAVALNRAASGFGLPSLVWLRDNEPDALDRAACVLCPKDYVRARLCAEMGQEASDASSTCCLDVKNVEWAWDILRKLKLPEHIFPPVARSHELAGALTAEGAERCGLPAGTPLYFGGADNGMAGIGSGIVEEGDIGVNIGTGGQVGTIASTPYFDAEFRTSTFCHPIAGRWSLFGATLAAGLSLKWYRETFHRTREFADLDDMAARAEPGSRDLFFLPYLAGERTPWLDPAARGVFWGMTLRHGETEAIRAVLEGVAYALDQSFQLIKAAGVVPRRMLSTGGGAKSSVWPQIQADMFGMPVHAVSGGDACVGAAIVAGVGAGMFKDVFEGCRAAVAPGGKIYEPNPEAQRIYAERKSFFADLYLKNRELFARISVMP